MNKEFIPYEQALTLKELGFDEPCFKGYTEEYKSLINFSNLTYNTKVKNTLPTKPFTAPLYQQAFRWFREKHTYNASVYPLTGKFSSQVYDIFRGCYITKIDLYETYEEAELECLKKLIEIVKENK